MKLTCSILAVAAAVASAQDRPLTAPATTSLTAAPAATSLTAVPQATSLTYATGISRTNTATTSTTGAFYPTAASTGATTGAFYPTTNLFNPTPTTYNPYATTACNPYNINQPSVSATPQYVYNQGQYGAPVSTPQYVFNQATGQYQPSRQLQQVPQPAVSPQFTYNPAQYAQPSTAFNPFSSLTFPSAVGTSAQAVQISQTTASTTPTRATTTTTTPTTTGGTPLAVPSTALTGITSAAAAPQYFNAATGQYQIQQTASTGYYPTIPSATTGVYNPFGTNALCNPYTTTPYQTPSFYPATPSYTYPTLPPYSTVPPTPAPTPKPAYVWDESQSTYVLSTELAPTPAPAPASVRWVYDNAQKRYVQQSAPAATARPTATPTAPTPPTSDTTIPTSANTRCGGVIGVFFQPCPRGFVCNLAASSNQGTCTPESQFGITDAGQPRG